MPPGPALVCHENYIGCASMCYTSKLLLLVPLLTLVGCVNQGSKSNGEYWVTGLTLPSNSIIIKKVEHEFNEADETAMRKRVKRNYAQDLPRPIVRLLVVSFNCPGGWDAVSSHIDNCLASQGYAKMDLVPEIKNSNDPKMAEVFGTLRTYRKTGDRYLVEITVPYVGTTPPTGIGEFELMVYRFR
jgi:hypothetical protein